MTVLTGKPWSRPDAVAPDEIFATKGMLGEEERRSFFWLAKNVFKGYGVIIDAGSFIGASAMCFASGLAHGGHGNTTRPLVHAYDYFAAFDDYVADAISRDVRPLAVGDSYLDIFQQQTRPYAHMVKSYSGDFLQHRWTGGPVEILFIDVAKTQELNSHAMREFFPALVPGQSVVVHQDFYHLWHPYIHISMQYLKDCFELADGLVSYQSRIYRLKRPIPPHMLERVVKYDFTMEERRQLLREFASESEGRMKGMADAILLWQCLIDQDGPAYLAERARFEAMHPDHATSPELWAVEAVKLHDYARPVLAAMNGGAAAPAAAAPAAPAAPAAAATGAVAGDEAFPLEAKEQLLTTIIHNFPSLHRKPDGSPWFLGISGDNLNFIASHLRPGMRTVETGAGFSSLAFIASGCHHTAIAPDGYLEGNIREYCNQFGINHSRFSFIDAGSQDVLPTLEGEYDFAFVDGDHAFPLPMIDFYYMARRMKVGGIMGIDDTTLWTGEVIAKFMQAETGWQFIGEKDGKTSYFRMIQPWQDRGFGLQSFVLLNSRGIPDEYITSLKR